MIDLIMTALNDAMLSLDKQVPKTKLTLKSIDIDGVEPYDLPKFMYEHNVPKDADFDGYDNGYDGWEWGRVRLSWKVSIPTNEKDDLKYRRKRFTDIAWNRMYMLMLVSGYKRVGYSTAHLKQFDDTTVYDMFIANDFERLVKYYSLPFNPL